MNDKSHVIFRLEVHLQGQQSVYFLPGLEEEALNRVAVNNSHITAWFDLNINVDHARTILYKDIPKFYKFDAKQRALSHIQQLLPKQLSEYNLPDSLPQPQHLQTQNTMNNIEAFENTEQMRNTLTADQQRLCDAVLQSVRECRTSQLIEHKLLSVDGAGGSGNTFCYNYLINELQYWGLSVSSSASTGIVSTLLRDGSTIHSTSTCARRPNSIESDRLRQIALFILDETSMLSLDILHCVDRLLRDMVGNNIPFGVKPFF